MGGRRKLLAGTTACLALLGAGLTQIGSFGDSASAVTATAASSCPGGAGSSPDGVFTCGGPNATTVGAGPELVQGFVYADIDRNSHPGLDGAVTVSDSPTGSAPSADYGIGGVRVTLFSEAGATLGSVITSKDGWYSFAGVSSSTAYRLKVHLPGGYTATPVVEDQSPSPSSSLIGPDGVASFVTREGGRPLPGDRFDYSQGLIPPAGTPRPQKGAIQIRTFVDFDQNGQIAGGLKELNYGLVDDVTVLYAGTTNHYLANKYWTYHGVGRSPNNKIGYVTFTNLVVGVCYDVKVNAPLTTFANNTRQTVPSRWTAANVGDDRTDSDVDANGFVRLCPTAASPNRAVGAGAVPLVPAFPAPNATIGNRVWLDQNGNGTQETSEPGVGNVNITLIDDSPKAINDPSLASHSALAAGPANAEGWYGFGGLRPDRCYELRAQIPPGYALTAARVGAANRNSDFVAGGPTGATTGRVCFDTGTTRTDIDLGLRRL